MAIHGMIIKTSYMSYMDYGSNAEMSLSFVSGDIHHAAGGSRSEFPFAGNAWMR